MDKSQQSLEIKINYEGETHDITAKSNDTILDLKTYIFSILTKTLKDLNINDISFRFGFPPKLIEGSENNEATLKDMKIGNREMLRIEIKKSEQSVTKTSNTQSSNNQTGNMGNQTKTTNSVSDKNKKIWDDPIDYSKYSVYRKIIAADNSCLFNAVNYAINQVISEPQIMRELITIEILSNPDLYCEAVLDKIPEEYCNWIMNPESWGGGIEVSIFSKNFQVSIGVVDVVNTTIEYIGEVYYI